MIQSFFSWIIGLDWYKGNEINTLAIIYFYTGSDMKLGEEVIWMVAELYGHAAELASGNHVETAARVTQAGW